MKQIFMLLIISFVLLSACGEGNEAMNTLPAKPTEVYKTLSLDTFSTFPPEISGCSCYFSSDSIELNGNEYIYMSDGAQLSFLKVNGALVKFTQTNLEKLDSINTVIKFKSVDYALTVKIKNGQQRGEETWLKTGVITLTDKSGKTVVQNFYGECGC